MRLIVSQLTKFQAFLYIDDTESVRKHELSYPTGNLRHQRTDRVLGANIGKAATTKALLVLAQSGVIDLAVTSRIVDDIPTPPLADRINELSQIRVDRIESAFRLDRSALGGGDMLGSSEFIKVVEQIERTFDRQGRVRKRPDWRDWDHIHGHYLCGRDFFLTWDRPILYAAVELQAQLGIVVKKPEDFLSYYFS